MTKRAAIYLRVSTGNQTTDNQMRDLQQAADRFGWTIVGVYSDVGISGTRGREARPGFDGLMRAVSRREVDLVAAWSVDRLGRSLGDLVLFLAEIRDRNVGLYLHIQGLDTTSPAGRAFYSMLGIFSEFEAAIIKGRVVAGLERAKAEGKRLGRPPLPTSTTQRIRAGLLEGKSLRVVARDTGVSPTTVAKVRDADLAGDGKATPCR